MRKTPLLFTLTEPLSMLITQCLIGMCVLLYSQMSDDDRMSLTTAVSDDDDVESVHNSPYRAKQTGTAAASFNCTGAVRKAGWVQCIEFHLERAFSQFITGCRSAAPKMRERGKEREREWGRERATCRKRWNLRINSRRFPSATFCTRLAWIMSHDAKQERESGTRMENGNDETLHQWMVLVFLSEKGCWFIDRISFVRVIELLFGTRI